MSKFSYKTITKDQKIKEGVISAFFKFNAKKVLTRDGSMIISISSPKPFFLQMDLPFMGGFSRSEKIYFFRNLAMMVDSGISIIEALDVLSEQVKSQKAKKAILQIAEDIRNGRSLSDAMRKFPNYFPEYIIESVNMGNMAGRLSGTLDRIATDLEKDDELNKKVIGAIAYPLVVIVVMAIVVVTLMFYILPGISQLFIDLNAPLPLPTKILLNSGNFIRSNPFLVPGIILIIFAFFFFGLKFKKTRYLIHYLTIKLPIFGGLVKDYNLVLFFRSLESLFKSGVPIVAAVEIAKNTTKSEVYKKALEPVKPALLHGISLADSLTPFLNLFSKQTQKIIMVGEKAGKIEEAFSRISDYYERSVDYKTRMLTVLIEPVLMIVLGVVVGGLALSIFVPIYNLVNVL